MFRSSLDDMKVIQYRILKSYSSNAYILIDDVNTELPTPESMPRYFED
jgi:hypothetical protein